EGINWDHFINSIYDYVERTQSEPGNVVRRSDVVKRLQVSLLKACSRAITESLGLPPQSEATVQNFFRNELHPEQSRHYVSAGESVGITYLAQLFSQLQKPLIFGN